ncbi:CrcB family protein [Streptomyces sp. DSM 42041]|uniref:Fluoride-specific ion channel FluC n=1 Tax=Streptomyces hazeniae TaxID=3075538 RepID=A0ABU2NTF0_9ACTN|nr:CrcB family protein [Streptomyces sp. DSM 42041]MDT0379762.1 CrcB family protein [Streptomyces sp. DSM 42041]
MTRSGARRPSSDPVDSDVDLRLARHRAETVGRRRWPLLGAIACGGASGALARHALTLALPARPHGFPWGTFAVNGLGCALIGVLMVLIAEARPGPGRWRAAWSHPLARPFLGVGVLGGFTTFSTYAVEAVARAADGRPGVALVSVAATPLVAVAAVAAGAWGTRRVVGRRRP